MNELDVELAKPRMVSHYDIVQVSGSVVRPSVAALERQIHSLRAQVEILRAQVEILQGQLSHDASSQCRNRRM